MEDQLRRQRGNGPSPLEYLVLLYVVGFIWEETNEILNEGIRSYLRNMWNFIDFSRNSLYCLTALLRYIQTYKYKYALYVYIQTATSLVSHLLLAQ